MDIKENFTIDKRYLKAIGKCIYNTELDKYGSITDIVIRKFISNFQISLQAYYDRIHSSEIVFFEDFEKGKLKFTIIDGLTSWITKEQKEEYDNSIIDDIKSIFSDKFNENMIIHVNEEDRKKKNDENDHKEVQKIHKKLIHLQKLSSDIFYDDYTSCDAYTKYVNGDISEKEMLYIICNHLCQETRRLKDDNLNKYIEKLYNEKYSVWNIIK